MGSSNGSSGYRVVVLALIMGVQTAANIGALGLPSLAPLIRAHHTLLAELAGRDSAATAVGLCLAVSSVGVIVGPPLFGLFADRLHAYEWDWYGLAVAMLLALGLLSDVREPRRAPWT